MASHLSRQHKGTLARVALIALIAPLQSCADLTTQGGSLTQEGSEEKGYYLSTSLWASAEIPVCWEDLTTASDTDRERVQQVINESWGAYSPLSFTGWGECEVASRGIRIKVEDSHPHVKKLGRQLDGLRDGMLLNMDFKVWGGNCGATPERRAVCMKAIAVHEFGHALGLAHEQNRADTPGSCNDAPQGTNGDITVGDWDPSSVMNYCNERYANGGVLSVGDIATIQAAYAFLQSPDLSLPDAPPPQSNPSVQTCQVGRSHQGECTSGECRGAGFPDRCADEGQTCCVMLR